MHIDELWNKFGCLTNLKNKQEFAEMSAKIDKAISEMTEDQKKELQKATLEMIKTFNDGFSLEQRLAAQHSILKLTHQTNKNLTEFIAESKAKLKTQSVPS